MYILEANGDGLIEIALENGEEIQINVSETEDVKARVVIRTNEHVPVIHEILTSTS